MTIPIVSEDPSSAVDGNGSVVGQCMLVGYSSVLAHSASNYCIPQHTPLTTVSGLSMSNSGYRADNHC